MTRRPRLALLKLMVHCMILHRSVALPIVHPLLKRCTRPDLDVLGGSLF